MFLTNTLNKAINVSTFTSGIFSEMLQQQWYCSSK